MANKNKRNTASASSQWIDKLISTIDPSYTSDTNLNEKTESFKKIMNDQLLLTKGVSKDSIVDFSRALNADITKPKNNQPIDDDEYYKYIAANAGGIYSAYMESNRNKFIELNDLQFISRFVPSLGQCVNIALTHIISSDDLSGDIQRVLDFGSAASDSDIAIARSAIEKFETDNNLLHRLKLAYKYALVSGEHHAYVKDYHDLFLEYQKTLDSKRKGMRTKGFKPSNFNMPAAQESVEVSEYDLDFSDLTIQDCAFESADIKEIREALSPLKDDKLDASDTAIKNDFMSNLATFECIDSSIPYPILDMIPAFKQARDPYEAFAMAAEASSDGKSKDIEQQKSDDERFKISGTYIKFIKASNLIPIQALDEIVAYIYVDPRKDKTKKNSVEVSVGRMSSIKKENAAEKAAMIMAGKLAAVFSEKFVTKHTNFKKIMADCIMANGVINTDYKIQIIPVEDIVTFAIAEDEHGKGTSMLAESLFPAKLLTNIMIKKNLNYVNNSGDKTLAYIRRGKSDIHGSNQNMQIIRGLQEAQVTFQDIFNSSLTLHKFSSDGMVMIPQSMSGQHLVDFEKMEGQQVEMNTEYEKYLENMALLGSTVPPLLIEQANNADFAKAYTTAHVGFAGIIAERQSDLENGTTKLYKKIIHGLSIDQGVKDRLIDSFKFKLPRPKALANTNDGDNLNAAVQLAETFVNLRYGTDGNDDEKEAINQIKYAVVKSRCPFIKWDELEEISDEVMAEYKKIKDDTPEDDSLMDGGSTNEGDDMSF